MAIFQTNKSKVLNYLREHADGSTVDEMAENIDLSKTKIKQTLMGLKYKNEAQLVDNKWSIILKSQAVNNNSGRADDIITPSNLVAHSMEDSAVQNYNPVPSATEGNVNSASQNPETQRQGLTAKIDHLEKKIDFALGVKPAKEKKAKIRKFSAGKVKRFNKKNFRACVVLGRDQNFRIVKGEMIEGMIKIGENFYDGSALYVWLVDGKQPIYLIPEFSIRPFAYGQITDETKAISAKDIYDKAVRDETLIDSQVITLRAMKLIEQDVEDIKKKKPNLLVWILIGGAILVGAWLFLGGKK